MNCMSRRSQNPSGRGRRRKPLLLPILLENVVAQRVERISKWGPVAASIRSINVAVATSPKMKWQSRSPHSRWPEQISGFTTSADRTRAHHIRRPDAERSRRTGDTHVKSKAIYPQRVLDFDGDGGIGALHIRRRKDHQIHIFCGLPAWARAFSRASTTISAITPCSSSLR